MSLPYQESVYEPQEEEGHSYDDRSVGEPLRPAQLSQAEPGDGEGVASSLGRHEYGEPDDEEDGDTGGVADIEHPLLI